MLWYFLFPLHTSVLNFIKKYCFYIFSANVQPVCMPTTEMDLNGKFAIVSGWGVTETGKEFQ